MMTRDIPIQVRFTEGAAGIEARTSPVDGSDQRRAQEALAEAVARGGYQRVSGFMGYGAPGTNEVEAACRVVRLREQAEEVREEIALPFEDDPSVVGKWEVIGEYAVKEDFFAQRPSEGENFGERIREICFLSGGQRYWCYGWTRGKLLHENGDGSTVNEFTTEEYEGQRYMFVRWKSYEYRRGGEPTVLVLRQKDNVSYTAEELAVRDDIDRPFVPDDRVLGKWRAVAYCPSPREFDPQRHSRERCFFSETEFFPEGEIVSLYGCGEQRVAGAHRQTWTKGFVLRKWNETACAYCLREVEGQEYLFIQWKSGDYIWGGMEPEWYAFVRA